jgi:hypothetical protein
MLFCKPKSWAAGQLFRYNLFQLPLELSGVVPFSLWPAIQPLPQDTLPDVVRYSKEVVWQLRLQEGTTEMKNFNSEQ